VGRACSSYRPRVGFYPLFLYVVARGHSSDRVGDRTATSSVTSRTTCEAYSSLLTFATGGALAIRLAWENCCSRSMDTPATRSSASL
jgi:hypothetical protein